MVSFNKRKHALWIQLTAALSLVSLISVSVTFGTQHWINAIAVPHFEGTAVSLINYGLFSGTLIRRPLNSPYLYDIYFTCIWEENACAWSCAGTKDSRKTEVQYLIDGKKKSFACDATQSDTLIKEFWSRVSDDELPVITNARIFTNAGLWLSTIIFLVILLLAIMASFVLSIINCTQSPIETLFNVQGIYLANVIALIANFTVMLLYGLCYAVYIKEDISIYDTIIGDYRSESWLGYSYWLLFLPFILHPVEIGLIFWRERIVNSDRAETKIDIATVTPASGVLF